MNEDDYKVGDKFEVLRSCAVFEGGSVVELYRKPTNNNSPLFKLISGYCEYNNADGAPGAYTGYHNVRKINDYSDNKSYIKEPNMYEFNVSSVDAVDFSEILSDLDRQNPIAKVEFRGEEGSRQYYAVIHSSLIDKAALLEIEFDGRIVESNYIVLESPSVYQEVFDWVKRVKNAEWDDEKGVVTVTKVGV